MSSDQERTPEQRPGSSRTPVGFFGRLLQVGRGVHALLVCGLLFAVCFTFISFVGAAAKRKPPHLPATMEEVDWKSRESSRYCLACHKPVGPAMAGLDVAHGHPQNVPLNDSQIQAVKDLNTVLGPDNTLICMSCHQLGERATKPNMLADTLEDGKLCEHCHPGHYARNTPHDLRRSAPDERNRLGQTVTEGGPCSACHLAHRYARDFQPCDPDPDGRCTSCHQAYHCAEKHARTVMHHPESRCMGCHDPHDMTHSEFLKAPIGELCITCHDGYEGGAPAGMHPMGLMDSPVPQELILAGAWVQSDSHELTCVICHSTHTSNEEHLLVYNPDTNQLCLACHEDKRAVPTAMGAAPQHGESPVLNGDQLAIVSHWEAPVGPNNELLCVSCHRVHGSKSPMALLAFLPKYGETCGACHPHHDGVFGSSHDLRTNFPDEQNIAGMTPSEYGACSACHLAHRYARDVKPTVSDPAGQCVTCHQPDSCGEARLAEGVQHPETSCTDCHNPHERRFKNYLTAEQVAVCSECHTEQTRLIGGPHDVSANPENWPDVATSPGGVCLSCHVPHGGERGDLFRVHGEQTVENHDDVCLVCHKDSGWGAASGVAAIHPHDISPDQELVELALVPKDDAGNMRMGCRTCHDPHGGATPIHLARVGPDEPTARLCIHCHEDKQFIENTAHSAARLSALGIDVDSCKPCHAMHATAGGTWGSMLSPRFLKEGCEAVDVTIGECVPCLACHHPNGPAPVRAIATHPADKAMFNAIAPDAPGYLPLFNAEGNVDPAGHVTCRTCHVSHGRLDLLRRVADRETLSSAEQSAIRTQVRSFITPNICTECHGAEARARFLFFHDPQRRAFPRQDPTQQNLRSRPGGAPG